MPTNFVRRSLSRYQRQTHFQMKKKMSFLLSRHQALLSYTKARPLLLPYRCQI